MQNYHSKTITTNDGAILQYYENKLSKDNHQTLVMIPGGAVAANAFKYQMAAFDKHYHSIAINMRGHGESEDPGYGYRISRLAKDLHDFLIQQDLQDVVLLGHSLGCSVIWSYCELFKSERLQKIILVDEPPVLLANPIWAEKECTQYGAVMTKDSIFDFTNQLRTVGGEQALKQLIDTATTPNCSAEIKEYILKGMLQMPLARIADLYFNNMCQDWRAVIPMINIPTLIFGGRGSSIPWQSQVFIHEQIHNSQLEIFGAEEGGSHFMFLENPDKFNRLVKEFIDKV